MTDLELSKALALAIGWTENRLDENGCLDPDVITEGELFGKLFGQEDGVFVWFDEIQWRGFDYRDPAVIWPIAERYNAFPLRWRDEGWCVGDQLAVFDTAAKAVAFAVIGRAA